MQLAHFCYFIAFGLSIAVGERAKKKQMSQRESRTKIEWKSTENRLKIHQNRRKSKKIPSQAVWDARNRFGNALGRARDVTGTPKTRLRADLGAPRASQERPGAVRKRPWASPERLPDRPAAVSKRVWSIERCRTCSRNDCWSFLHCCAEAPMCVSYQFLQCFVGFERNKEQTHGCDEKPRK